MKNDVIGEALWDYHQGIISHKLWIHNRYGRKEEMPVSIYFRTLPEMPEMEQLALTHCTGTVLDIGCGAGSHSLQLQAMGLPTTALDISPKAIEVAHLRGVKKTLSTDIYELESPRYQTLLLLMNGIGLCGNLKGLTRFLEHAKNLLNKGGQILFDSSDVAYLYTKKPKPYQHYYGEIEYQYEYKGKKTDWFQWLYVDAQTLTSLASAAGWQTNILFDDGYDQYLVQLTLKGN